MDVWGGGALQFFGEGMNWPGGLNSPPPLQKCLFGGKVKESR